MSKSGIKARVKAKRVKVSGQAVLKNIPTTKELHAPYTKGQTK